MSGLNAHIAILGSGVVGLTSALELRSRGARVTVYSDPSGSPGASRAAPALFTPYPGPDGALFRRWSERSFERLRRIADEAGPDSGVHLGALRQYWHRPGPDDRWLHNLLSVRPIRPVPAPFVDATTSTCPHVDMQRYLPWLESRARESGVEFVDLRVHALDELFALGHRVVVNCAGLGARELAADPLVRPMHGQVMHVPNDIGLDYSLHDDAPNDLVAYIFVFRDRLVLGGTFDKEREDDRTDPGALDAIIERCRDLLRLDGHPRWQDLARTRIRALAGVRPARGAEGWYEDIRVERIDLPGGRALVHNYGHGRSGVTLSWATAEDAAALALAEGR